jgi:hypothetical protein
MDDKRYPNEINLWCFVKEPGMELVCPSPRCHARKKLVSMISGGTSLLRDDVTAREVWQGKSVVPSGER